MNSQKPISVHVIRLLAMICCLFVYGCMKQPPLPGAFYKAPETPPAGKPGTILREEPFPGAPGGASAFRVLYISTGLEGESIAVSGIILIPAGPIPDGGRNVVAWAHPTTGVADRCAPSLRSLIFGTIPGLQQLLANNYVVTVTDYPGLGTDGPHPYLVGISEGRAVLDLVRASKNIAAAGASSKFAVWGHSQGGHAALFAGELAANYAPELSLVGVAATAPATELATLMQDDIRSASGKILTSYSLWSWTRVYQASTEGLVEPKAIPVVDRIADHCIETWGQVYKIAIEELPLQHSFLTGDPGTVQPWEGLFAKNTPGQAPAGAPLFIAQGTADVIVRPAVTTEFVKGLCRRGEKVKFVELPKIGHTDAAKDSASVTIEWIANRFTEDSPPDDCSFLLDWNVD